MFAVWYIGITRRVMCLFNNHYRYSSSIFYIIIIVNGAVGGAAGAVALMFETPGRQMEIALFTVNKGI